MVHTQQNVPAVIESKMPLLPLRAVGSFEHLERSMLQTTFEGNMLQTRLEFCRSRARRYVPSLLAVERWRAGAWWDQTLQPLRSREVAARLPASGSTAAAASAAAADAPADGQQQEDRQLLAGLQVSICPATAVACRGPCMQVALRTRLGPAAATPGAAGTAPEAVPCSSCSSCQGMNFGGLRELRLGAICSRYCCRTQQQTASVGCMLRSDAPCCSLHRRCRAAVAARWHGACSAPQTRCRRRRCAPPGACETPNPETPNPAARCVALRAGRCTSSHVLMELALPDRARRS